MNKKRLKERERKRKGKTWSRSYHNQQELAKLIWKKVEVIKDECK